MSSRRSTAPAHRAAVVVRLTAAAAVAALAGALGASADARPAADAAEDVDMTMSISPTRWVGGLNGRHTLRARNLGPDAATHVLAFEEMLEGERLLSARPSQGRCSQPAVAIRCELGTVKPGHTVTIVVTTKLPPNLGMLENRLAHTVSSDRNPENDHAYKPGAFPGRFWICRACANSELKNGLRVAGPGGMRILKDDTVILRDGKRIRPDGVLLLRDGRAVLHDGRIVRKPPPVRKP